ncbi:MAG: metallophosphoesterase family protein [Verrucomicrobiae bacterium]|nr:metallophosphoesterase family protein [Verrucomicrobiae bacterium]
MQKTLPFVLLCTFGLAITLRAERDPNRLTHGPMLGNPTAHSVEVWARTSDPGEFRVRYGTQEDVLDQESEAGVTHIEDDNTGTLTLTDLKSDQRYYYQIYMHDRPYGLPGSFLTLPDADDVRNPEYNPKGLFNFRFEIGCCANQNPLHGNGHRIRTYENLNRDWAGKTHFHIMNGDWLYEELRDFPAEAWRLECGIDKVPRVVDLMPSVVGVWENYRLYLERGVSLAQWHRNVPSYFTFDDHELVNDIWGAGTAGRRNRRAVFRDIGTYAFYNYLGWANPTVYDHPIHVSRGQMEEGSDLLVDKDTDFTKLPLDEMLNLHVHWGTPEAGENDLRYDESELGHPNSYVYSISEVVDPHTLRLHMPAKVTDTVTYSIGRRSYAHFRVSNSEFYLLDTRGSRDMHDTEHRDKKGISMLGKPQHEWLLNSMKNSDADFFFIVSTVPFMIPHSGAGGFEAAGNKEEAWTAFFDEREQLIAAWEEIGKPVFVMTGDLHNSFAIKITDTIWEFCCGPHNSVNHVPFNDEMDRPATGKFQFGPRECDIRWSSYVLPDLDRLERLYPHYAMVQVNNVFNMPQKLGGKRWVAYPHPQVVFQYYDGRTGELDYAEAVSLPRN